MCNEYLQDLFLEMHCAPIKGNTKFWYGVMNLVQMNILEAYAILQYSGQDINLAIKQCFLTKSTASLFPFGNYISQLHIMRFS